jgi:predicted phage tail protein
MQFYVLNVTRPEWTQFQFDVIQHEPSKFDAIDSGAVIDTRPISTLPTGDQVAPARVLISQNVMTEQGLAVTVMTIAWDSAAGAVAYDVEWRWGAREWIKVPRTGELSIDVRGIYSGQYMARVRAVSALGSSSLPTTSMLTQLDGKTGLPPAVTTLTATSLLFGIGLKWTFPPGAEDTQRTEIWYGPTTDVTAATKLADLAYPQHDYSLQSLLAGARFFFWARLVDRTGNVGPFYPTGIGILGQASADAGPILDLIAGQIGRSELGQEILTEIDKIPGLQDQIDALDNILVYDPDKTYLAGDTVQVGQRLYQAAVNVPAHTPPPNATYWLDIGQVVQTANGLAEQVELNTADITELDGVITAQATSLEALRASFRPTDDGTGVLADALKGWSNTASIATESQVRASQNLSTATQLTVVTASVNDNVATVTDLKQSVATDKAATAQTISQLTATVGDNTAAIQTTATAYADTSGKLTTMWSVKMQVASDGTYVAAGIGLGIENTGAGLQSTFVVSADKFAIVNTAAGGGGLSSPFVVTGGQVFIADAFIRSGSIGMLQIGAWLQSDNFVSGNTGWRLSRDGTFEMNGNIAGVGTMRLTNTSLKFIYTNGVVGVDLSL